MMPNFFKYIVLFLLFSTNSFAQETKEFFVSETGNDLYNGTIQLPFKTIERVQQAIREVDKSKFQGVIQVQLCEGNYIIAKPLIYSKEDGGNAHCRINYSAYKNRKVVFQAGYEVAGNWKIYENGIYSVLLNSIQDMRQLYVNGHRMTRATTTIFHKASWSADKKGIVIQKDQSFQLKSGKVSLEFVQETHWRLVRLPIDSVKDLENQYELSFQNEVFDTYTKANLSPWISAEKMFTIENSLDFLDIENEWFFDSAKHLLYFKPGKSIHLNKAEIYIPVQEKIIQIQGNSPDEPVENLHFSGITFQHSNWLEPNNGGLVPLQSTILVNSKGSMSGRVPGCITANFIRNVSFTGNRFEHLGATALYLENGINHVQINRNVFSDISGAAIDLGNISHEASNDGLPATSMIEITNNVFRDIATEYAGSAAISAYYIANTRIAHNDIDGTGYSGISIGWGWSEKISSMYNNRVDSNRIFNVMKRCWDGSPVYTLSRQANSGLVGNYVGQLNMAQHGSAGLYHDQGSAGFTDENNVIEIERPDLLAYMLNDSYGNIVRNNYANTGNSIVYFYEYHSQKPDDIIIEKFHIIPDSDWPSEAQDIIKHAGLEPKCQYLLSSVRPATPVKYEKKYFESPFVFAGEQVSMEAENYAHYKGIEQNIFSWIGVNAWFTGYSGSRALIAQATTIADHPNFTEMPMVGYNIRFDHAGEYYLYIRAKGDKEKNAISWGLNDQKLGEADGWGKEFSWQKPVKLTIAKAGVHRLDIWMKTETFYLDKITIAKSSNAIVPNSLEKGFPESQHEITIPPNANYLRITQ